LLLKLFRFDFIYCRYHEKEIHFIELKFEFYEIFLEVDADVLDFHFHEQLKLFVRFEFLTISDYDLSNERLKDSF
jgi:hypothetical protein